MNTATTEIDTAHMVAPCGHHDILGYLLDAPCADCTKQAHKRATGIGRSTKKKVR